MHNGLPDAQLSSVFAGLGFVTGSDSVLPVLRLAQRAACASDITVLIEGETGTGKQVLANAIHQLDNKRCAYPFVTVHCGTISEALAESELFGHQKGAFSGAIHERKGLFLAAGQGTLFLDDINDLPLALQTKLLDVLQRRALRPVGSDREVPVHARIIAASNQPLVPLVRENRFRSDLYHRLNVVKLSLPALRERPLDIPELLRAFVAQHAELYPKISKVDPELILFLQRQPFPGNVRELEHAVQRVLFDKTEGNSLDLSDWVRQNQPTEPQRERDVFHEAGAELWKAIVQQGLTYKDAMYRLEKRLLEAALESGGRTRREIASCLQTSERTLYHRLHSHRLS